MDFYESDESPEHIEAIFDNGVKHITRPSLLAEAFGKYAGLHREHEFLPHISLGYGFCYYCWGDRDDTRHWLPYEIQQRIDSFVKENCDNQPLTQGIATPQRRHRWKKKEPRHVDHSVS